MRLLALLLLLAVLPTVELAEQAAHAVEHVLQGEAPDHSAHHGEAPGDEHGCTGLVHLCGTHQAQATVGVAPVAARGIELQASVALEAPPTLADLTSREPEYRPPIG